MQEPPAASSRRDGPAAWLGALGALVLFVGGFAVFGATGDDGTDRIAAGAPVGDGAVALGANDEAGEALTASSGDAGHSHDDGSDAPHAHDDGTMAHDPGDGHHDDGTTASHHDDTNHVDGHHDDTDHDPNAHDPGAHDPGDGHHDTGTAGGPPHDPGDGHHEPGSPPASGGGGHDDGHGHPPAPPGSPTPPGHPHPPAPGPQPTGPIISLDDPRVTTEQRAAAQLLIDRTRYAMTPFPTVESVQAAGYGWIGDGGGNGYEHWVNWGYLGDGHELDPARIESIVVQRMPDGTKRVASAMYILELGKTMDQVPDIAGELTKWHDHRNLCWRGSSLAGVLGPDGQCPPGSELRVTPPMLHVWMVAHPCGPFAGIEGAHGSGCGHDH
jgi:hypothetical protein